MDGERKHNKYENKPISFLFILKKTCEIKNEESKNAL